MSASLTFRVVGKPVGINESYARGRNRKTGAPVFYKRAEAKQYQERIKQAAWIHAQKTSFPCSNASAIQVSIKMFGVHHDIDAPVKLCLDALAGVCYIDDRQVKKLLVESLPTDEEPQLWISVRTL